VAANFPVKDSRGSGASSDRTAWHTTAKPVRKKGLCAEPRGSVDVLPRRRRTRAAWCPVAHGGGGFLCVDRDAGVDDRKDEKRKRREEGCGNSAWKMTEKIKTKHQPGSHNQECLTSQGIVGTDMEVADGEGPSSS